MDHDSPPGVDLGREFTTSLVLFQGAIAARLGLNATDYRCLEVILRKGQMTAKALAEEVRLTTGAITGVVDHLEKAGYVERLENPRDRRSVIISPLITHQGLAEKLGNAMVDYRAAMSELFGRYDAAQTAVILDFLGEFVRLLKVQTSRLQDGPDGR
ncbi:MAG: MarR family transcriptional regulator [Nitrososphaerales archaeon]|jgi:DNA-binding MarR family transcriptional regulator